MSSRLFEAARTGDVETLRKLIQENPLILADYTLISPHENLLHVATKAGKLCFVQEMVRLKLDSVRELNKDGFRPLDIASALGHVEIVKELLTSTNRADHDICRLKGREGRVAIHYAAISGKLEIMDELVSFSKECVKDLTTLRETALHLALKFYKVEAFRNLVNWLEKLGLEEMVNWGDEDGNTVLHLAVSRKQHESVQLLLSSTKVDINARNARGLTAIDIVDILAETPNDFQLRETLLQHAYNTSNGVVSSRGNIATNAPSSTTNITQEPRDDKNDWIKYFRYQRKRDSPSDTRNALLVVATLIATVTFQAGVNPPSSFSVEKSGHKMRNRTNSTAGKKITVLDQEANSLAPSPGLSTELIVPLPYPPVTIGFGAVLANLATVVASELFLFGNSLGLAASLNVIIYLTAGFPFQRELHISIYSMMFAYGWSLQDLQAEQSLKTIILVFAFLLPFSLRWLPRWAKRIRKWWMSKRIMNSTDDEQYPL